MADRSFRDRFFSPQVARAVTSPSAILALGAGVAVGIVATAPVSVPLAVVGGVAGGVLGYGARVAAAVPRKKAAEAHQIDPFEVSEPWRHAVIDAIRAQTRFREAVSNFRDGPLAERMAAIGDQIDDAVQECWSIAKEGHLVATARQQIHDREARWELEQARTAAALADAPNETVDRRIQSLESQVATADRMDALIADTTARLDLLDARLDEAVTRAIELSVSNRTDDAERLGSDVGAIVEEMESLRQAIEVVGDQGTTGR